MASQHAISKEEAIRRIEGIKDSHMKMLDNITHPQVKQDFALAGEALQLALDNLRRGPWIIEVLNRAHLRLSAVKHLTHRPMNEGGEVRIRSSIIPMAINRKISKMAGYFKR